MAHVTECEAGYEGLAAAVIRQAAVDYENALACVNGRRKCTVRHPMETALYELSSCERFFTGQWIRVLSELDGPYIMNRIQEEEERRVKKKSKRGKKAHS